MDLERLDEELASHDRLIEKARERYPKAEVALLPKIILEAARAYRDLLANGERVEWCETHQASTDDEATPMGAVACWKALKGLGDSNDCVVGGRLLVDPPKEEKR